MYIKGSVVQDGEWWVAELPSFCIGSQGTDKENAREMLASAVHDLLPEMEFDMVWTDEERGELALNTAHVATALGFIIRQNRSGSDQSLREIAAALGSKYPNAVAVYEKGESEASISKMDSILGAIGKRLVVTIE
jgi:uncharacterized protein (DUF2342 family)